MRENIQPPDVDPISVRRAGPADADAIVRIYVDAWREGFGAWRDRHG